MIDRRKARVTLGLAVVIPLGAGLAISQTPPSNPTPGRISPGQAAADLGSITNDVSEARRLVANVGDRALRDRIDLLLSRAELNARSLRDKLSAAASTTAAPPTIAAMSPEKFDEFLAALKKHPFDPGKARFLEDFAKTQRFNASQATTLLKAFAFDQDRVKAAAALYPSLVDRGDFYKILDAFTFEQGKEAARKAAGLR